SSGYAVVAVVDTGEEALAAAGKLSPDLVLMDIRLKGRLDGIEAAGAIRTQYDIPVVYLTARSDPDTLHRAKLSAPSGYLTKPISGASLRTTIEVALHQHKLQRESRECEPWLATTFRSLDLALIVTDTRGRILFLNPEAERLTRIAEVQARGKPL